MNRNRTGGQKIPGRKGLWVAAAAVLILLTALGGSLLVLFQFYDKYNLSRRDPLGLESFPSPQPGFYSTILIGDSLVANFPAPSQDWLNLGISGQTSAQVRWRAALLDPGIRGERSLVCAGGNDLKYLTLHPEALDQMVQEALRNLESTVDVLQVRSQRVYILSIPPLTHVPFYSRWFFSADVVALGIQKLNAGMKTLAARRGCLFIDLDPLFETEPADLLLAGDGVHLSEKAYRFIGDHLTWGRSELD